MILAGCATLGLSACGAKAPSGQVVAVANGEDVTAGEIRAEAAAIGSRAQPGMLAPPALLRAVVDRKLWAHEARRVGLDQEIDYILAKRRSDEALLAELQLRILRDSVAAPSIREVDEFLRTHPAAFRERTIFSIDQINVRPEDDGGLLARISKAGTLRDVETMLDGEGIVGQRGKTQWNSLFMPASLAARLTRLSPDALFVYPSGDTVIAANVIGKTSVPLSGPERTLLVRQGMTRQRIDAAVAKRLVDLRAAADIRLQPGYVIADPR